MTPLDSSHLEAFLGIFWDFFIFLNLNLNFEFEPIWYRPKSESSRTDLTANLTADGGGRRPPGARARGQCAARGGQQGPRSKACGGEVPTLEQVGGGQHVVPR